MARATLVTPSGPLGRLTNVIIGSPRGKAPAFETDGAAETKQAREKPGWKNPKKIQGWGVCAGRWLLKPDPAFVHAKIPPGVGFSTRPWRPAVQEAEHLFQPLLLS